MRTAIPYDSIAPEQRWHAAPETIADRFSEIASAPRFVFDADAGIATAGSCFAARLAERLRTSGLRFVATEAGPPTMSHEDRLAHGYWPYPARFGNIYTTLQLLQLFERAYGRRLPHENVWERDGVFFDPFRPRISRTGFSNAGELLADRDDHLRAVRELFETVDVFVFTLGLTEVWTDAVDGSAFPICPGVTAGTFDRERYVFRNLSVEENATYLSEFADALVAVNPTVRIILTVSPVAIAATMEPYHVVVASTLSKSILRLAAEEVRRSRPYVDYFPAYEMATSPWCSIDAFQSDRRHIEPEIAAHIASAFLGTYYPGVRERNVSAAQGVEPERPLACDEDLLLGF